VTVWGFFLIFKVYGERLEVLTWYSLIQLAGFLILLLGVFVYNEILIIPFCGLNTNTKAAIEKRKHENFSSGAYSEITYKSNN
jgi:hypothetical protein